MQKSEKTIDVLILGSGAAGLSAAIYTARAELETVVLTGPTYGGQISLTAEVENYPGVPENLSGLDLIAKFIQQAESFGATLDYDTAVNVDFNTRPFRIETEGTIYHAENLIIATGAKAILLNVPGEKELTGMGVSYCATCDGAFFRGKQVAVVGGGNSAVEEALFLTKFAESVTIIHRRDALRADPIIQKKAFDNPKIKFLWDSVVAEVVGSESMSALKVKNVKTDVVSELLFDGVFVFIGHKPASELFRGKLEMDESGIIQVDAGMRTNVRGIYAAGESVDGQYRQMIVSAALGAMAAITLTKDRT